MSGGDENACHITKAYQHMSDNPSGWVGEKDTVGDVHRVSTLRIATICW
jgi:hypothetical protein